MLLAFAAYALVGCTSVSESTTSVAVNGTMMTGDRDRGATVFATRCAACHGATGAGGDLGPSLRGENQRLDYSALVSWVEDPQPPMPKLYPRSLSRQQVLDVAAYVQRL
jgi:mono/diheme cytochrome c family protein